MTVKPLLSTSFTCNSTSFWDLSFNNSCSLLLGSAPPLDDQWLGVEIKKKLFSSVLSKTELIALKALAADNRFPYSGRFIGGLNEQVPICLFKLNSIVSCGFVFVCSINVSVCF